MTAHGPTLLALAISVAVSPATVGMAGADPPGPAGTRLAGVRMGPHAVGFDVRQGLDPTRSVNLDDGEYQSRNCNVVPGPRQRPGQR